MAEGPLSPTAPAITNDVGDPNIRDAVSTLPAEPTALDATPEKRKKPPVVAVIGGGAAGLAAAQSLMRGGARAVVFEARARVGGRVLTTRLTPDANIPFSELAYRGPPPRAAAAPLADGPPSDHLPTSPSALPFNAPALSSSPASPHTPQEDDPPTPAAIEALQTPVMLPVRTSKRLKKRKEEPGEPEIGASSPLRVSSKSPSPNTAKSPTSPRVRVSKRSRKKPTKSAPAPGARTENVDIGASIMHGCGDSIQFVLKRAIRDKIRAPVAAGGVVYESTTAAAWFDTDGQRIPAREIVEMHRVYSLVLRHVGADATYSDDSTLGLREAWNFGVDHVEEHCGRAFSPRERAILEKIAARGTGYCAPMRDMALQQAATNVNERTINYQIGMPFDEDDPPRPGELALLVSSEIASEARLWDKWIAANEPPTTPVASMRGGTGDRIVLDGYTPFLIDKLAVDIEVRLETIVKRITAVKPLPLKVQRAGPWCVGYTSTSGSKKARPSPPRESAYIKIETADGDMFECDYAIVTLPLGVLQGKHEKSSVKFCPPLSEDKMMAIKGLGMGVHNKVVLRFREEDVFWPRNTPQLNCLDLRFQFFNLHAYGKTGVLLVHVFGESGFAHGYKGLSDKDVVDEVVGVLHKTFCGTGKWMNKVPRSEFKTKSGSRNKGRTGSSPHRPAQKKTASVATSQHTPKRARTRTNNRRTRASLKSPQNQESDAMVSRVLPSPAASINEAPLTACMYPSESVLEPSNVVELRRKSDLIAQVVLSSRTESKATASMEVIERKKTNDWNGGNVPTISESCSSPVQNTPIADEEELLDSSDIAQPSKPLRSAKRRKTKKRTIRSPQKSASIHRTMKSLGSEGDTHAIPTPKSCQPKKNDMSNTEGTTPNTQVLKPKVTEAIIESGCGLRGPPLEPSLSGTLKDGQAIKKQFRFSSTRSMVPIPVKQKGLSNEGRTIEVDEVVLDSSDFGPLSILNRPTDKKTVITCVDEEVLDGSKKVPVKPVNTEQDNSNGSDIGVLNTHPEQKEEIVIDGSGLDAKSIAVGNVSKSSHAPALETEEEEVLDGSDIPAPTTLQRGVLKADEGEPGLAAKLDEEILDGSGIESKGTKIDQECQIDRAHDELKAAVTMTGGESKPKDFENNPALKLVDSPAEEETLEECCDSSDDKKSKEDFNPGCPLPRPVHYIVTRWDSDPFSLGSYSYVPIGGDFSMIEEFKVPEKMGTGESILFFAGEHASDLGWQCVHGAYETGLIAAHGVLIAAGLVAKGSQFRDLDEEESSTPKEETSKRPKKKKRQSTVDDKTLGPE